MVENLRVKALLAYEAIFGNKKTVEIGGRILHLGYSSASSLRRFVIDGYSYIEQNPQKESAWARMAREGHRIMWVMKGRRYLAQVRDGVFHDLRKEEQAYAR